MTAFDWVAIIGAASWLPQVFGWIARRLATPRLRVIPGRTPELGYSSLGPIFNLPCAISSDRKDAVIERMTATITHENGQWTEFRWRTLNETFSQLKNQEGIAAEFGRNQTAIALKVSTLVLTEKLIGMQETNFEQDSRPLITLLDYKHEHYKKTEPEAYQQLTLKSKEFSDLMAFFQRRFKWQEGRYTVRLELRVVGVKKPTVQSFGFALNGIEVGRLRQNLESIERFAREMIIPAGEGSRPIQWNWANPLLEQSVAPTGVESVR